MPLATRMRMAAAGDSTTTLLNDIVWWFNLDEFSDGTGPVSRVDAVAAESLTDNNTVASATDGSDTVASFVRANSEYLSHVDGAKWRVGNNSVTLVGWIKPTTLNTNAGYISKRNEFILNHAAGNNPQFYLYNGSSTVVAQVTVPAALSELSTGTWYPFRCGYDQANGRGFFQIGTGGLYYEKDVSATPGSSAFDLFVGAFLTQYYNGLSKHHAKYSRLLTWGEWVQFCSGVVYPFDGVPAPSTQPRFNIATAGRANLTNFEASVGTSYSKVVVLGDSWADLSYIPARLRSELQTEYGDGGIGYWSFLNTLGSQDARVTSISRTGTWAETSNAGLGIDASHVTITNTATLNFTATFDSISIHYRQFTSGGIFKYQIDGGGYTNVDTNSTNTYQTVTIGGLSDTSHTVNIEWVSGTCTLFGAYMTSGSTGIVVNRCGHTGMTSGDLAGVNGANWTAAVNSFDPDLAIIILGTNDQSIDVTPATYVSNMDTIISRLPAGCDVLLTPAADNIRKWQGVTVYSLYDYSVSLYEGGNWDAFHSIDDFGSYGYSINMSWWDDTLHLNETGSNRFADLIISSFLTGW